MSMMRAGREDPAAFLFINIKMEILTWLFKDAASL